MLIFFTLKKCPYVLGFGRWTSSDEHADIGSGISAISQEGPKDRDAMKPGCKALDVAATTFSEAIQTSSYLKRFTSTNNCI